MKTPSTFPENLFTELSFFIQKGKQHAGAQVNSALVLVFWQIGSLINENLLQNEYADSGKEAVNHAAASLVEQFGYSFEEKNLRRMMQFAEVFPDFDIVMTLSRRLSWSHFLMLIPLTSREAKVYYAEKIAGEGWSVRETRRQIEQKDYERNQFTPSKIPMQGRRKSLF
ncbi:MAG: DUF1016 N-terminal domain-containing protein [Bacteroidia bacterium]